MHRQSPINILTDKTINIESSPANSLVINYYTNTACRQNLKNNGHAWEFNIFSENLHITGGPMHRGHTYRLRSIHCHWGRKNGHGSEHKIDNLPYAAEIHFVHWNSTVFESFDEAFVSPYANSLVVLGILVKIGKQNDELQRITKLLKLIEYKKDCISLPFQYDFRKLLPSCKTSYWSYYGSLTTPPYSEIVQWILFKEPIECSIDQIESMRKLQKNPLTDSVDDESCIESNFRQTFEMADRIVYDYE